MSGYQTGSDNRLTNDGTYSYTYDAEGNRLTRTKTATGEVTEYAWDYHNRLTKVTEKNSQGTVTQVVEYLYDVFNRRIGRKIDTSAPFDMANAVIERYVLDDIHNGLTSADGGNVVLDFVDPDGSGAQAIAMSKRYLYGEAVDQLFAQEDLSKTLGDTSRNLWPLVDHLGTVRDLVKQDGTIATHFKYDSFGNVTSGDTSKTRYLFTSREFDTATKLQYNRARYYDASVGRWISEDPLGFAAGDANVGRYVGNRLIDTVDPSGFVLIAIDGTCSRVFRESGDGFDFGNGRYRSHVRNFYEDYRLGRGERKFYFDGPDYMDGRDTADILVRAEAILGATFRANPAEKNNVVIIGHSRGGLIANELAFWLRGRGITVRFMGLYDPVDMARKVGHDDEKIPSNVRRAAVVIRAADPVTGTRSRWYFNTIDGGPENLSQTYSEMRIVGTHAAIGGAPNFGDLDPQPGFFDNSVEGNASASTDEFIRDEAGNAGIIFDNPNPTQYEFPPPYVPPANSLRTNSYVGE